jgi:hypothetical protein
MRWARRRLGGRAAGHRLPRATARVALLVLALAAGGGAAADPQSPPAAPRRLTFKDIRAHQTVRQQWDFTCGGAALALVLRHQYLVEVSEREVVETMLYNGDRSRILKERGFSLLDLKRYANARGFDATGYAALDLDALRAIGLPAIVPLDTLRFHHFVVFRGVAGDRVVVADPARGNLTLPIATFLEAWQGGVAFVVRSRADAAVPNRLAPRDEELIYPRPQHLAALLRSNVAFPTRR